MAISWDSFDKIWASTSPLTPYSFSDPNYAQGWNFVGSTPPARQMWDSIQKQNDEKFKYLRDNFGTPNIVTSSSQMTDTEKVYVYMGSEAGWNSGHWYYYDEGTSSWADGGVYNSVAFVTDTTLSIAGQPADAKAVGDALALKADLAGCTFTGNVTVGADFSVTGDTTLVDANVTDLTATNVNTTDIVVSGDATIGGNASVTGDISSANVTTSANGTIGGDLSVAGTSALEDLSVAGDSALTNLTVSGTTALAGTSTAPTPSADDNSTKIATTEYVKTEIKPIETDVTINDKRISNIEKLLQGNLYDYQTDSTSAYTKSVPSGAMPYAGLEKVGGKTIVWNQLQANTTSRTNGGVVFTFDSTNGTLTISEATQGATRSDIAYWLPGTATKIDWISGHKYLVSFGNTLISGVEPYVLLGTTIVFSQSQIITGDGSNTLLNVRVRPASDISTPFTITPEIFDLTLMFGAGNEPSTVAEFEAVFPASYYPHNEGELLSAGVTEVVSKDSNNATLHTFPIPTAIRNLEGYGWSAGSVYNYIDYEAKKYVQEVGSRAYASGDESDSTVITDGTTTYYPLTTAVETDISAYITDDNLIQVEAGGTLTFPNSNGDDYQIPVPSEETYMINLQEAINNG